MTVLFLISSLNYGGAEKQAVLDANMLSKEHNVFLGCFKSGPLEDLLDKKIKLISVKKNNYLTAVLRLIKVIRANHIKVIHSSLFASMIISALSSIITKVNVFWHFHSHEYDLPFWNGQLYKLLGKLNGVKKILFVNSELKAYLNSQFKFPVWKTGVLYNTASVKHSSKIKTSCNECIIGYIGRLVELKRVDLLVGLAEFLILKGYIGFKVNIIGDGAERQNLENIAAKKNLNGYIKFEGFRTDTEEYYNKMDIFVLPSQEECLSMSAIDAGAKGIPIVAFNIGGNSEIINPGKTGFVVNTKEEFFEKIYYLVTNKNIREQMGKEASVYCSDKFGEENHLAKLNALYKEIGLEIYRVEKRSLSLT